MLPVAIHPNTYTDILHQFLLRRYINKRRILYHLNMLRKHDPNPRGVEYHQRVIDG